MADLNSTEMARLRACLNKLAWGLATEQPPMAVPLTAALSHLTDALDTPTYTWHDVFSLLSSGSGLETSHSPVVLDATEVAMEQLRQACHRLNEALTTDQALHDLIADDDDAVILPEIADEEEPDLAELIAAQEAQEAAQLAAAIASKSTKEPPLSSSAVASSVPVTSSPANMDTILAQLAELETVTRDLRPVAEALAQTGGRDSDNHDDHSDDEAMPALPSGSEVGTATLNFAEAIDQSVLAKILAEGEPSPKANTIEKIKAAVEATQSIPRLAPEALAALTADETESESKSEPMSAATQTTGLGRFADYVMTTTPSPSATTPDAIPDAISAHARPPRVMPALAGAYFRAMPWQGVDTGVITLSIGSGADSSLSADHYRKLTGDRINPLLIATRNAILHSEQQAEMLNTDYRQQAAGRFFAALPWREQATAA